jgi:hypothetical protein
MRLAFPLESAPAADLWTTVTRIELMRCGTSIRTLHALAALLGQGEQILPRLV